jgi:hypothetical protein
MKDQDAHSLLPKSSAPELVEAFQQILISRSSTDLVKEDLMTYPQTWSLFRGRVLANSDTWWVHAKCFPLARHAGKNLFTALCSEPDSRSVEPCVIRCRVDREVAAPESGRVDLYRCLGAERLSFDGTMGLPGPRT